VAKKRREKPENIAKEREQQRVLKAEQRGESDNKIQNT